MNRIRAVFNILLGRPTAYRIIFTGATGTSEPHTAFYSCEFRPTIVGFTRNAP